ncbi:hypothetical protein AZF04_13590 [Alkalihalobacillus trypoxylicola]|uniref:Uncharacterized protein n=1 Tax=Alkalihalobacillus trypoxylicola TaxID=519424 RepID=A0A162CLV8_9BACI|nr:hypothetical protein AZF04_13590 [Alkalihalobacillus trypoxylicola]
MGKHLPKVKINQKPNRSVFIIKINNEMDSFNVILVSVRKTPLFKIKYVLITVQSVKIRSKLGIRGII